MSTKKKEKSEWRSCVGCERFYPRSVCTLHEQKCPHNPNNNNAQTPVKSNRTSDQDRSGFIQDGELHGLCKHIKHTTDLLPTARNDLVIVHPSAIKLSHFQITSNVVVEMNNKRTCGTIWPSTSIPVDGVGLKGPKMETLEANEGEIVCVSLAPCPSVIAEKLVVSGSNERSCVCFDKVQEQLLFELDDTVVLRGDVVVISYYGEQLRYQVDEVVGFCITQDDANTSEGGLQKNGENSVFDEMDGMFSALSVNGTAEKISSDVFTYNVSMGSTHIVLKSAHNTNAEKLSDREEGEKTTQLDHIGGLDTQLQMLRELVEMPFVHPSIYEQCGVRTPKGLIVHGMSGTGKTMLVRAFVDQLPNVYTTTINGPELTSKFHGETEQKFRDVFQKTRRKAPAVLVIDEFDAICPTRTSSSSESEKRVVATLLTLLDTIRDDELFAVIAITSKLEHVDIALRRPGRLDTEIEINVPNSTQRCDILNKLLAGCKHSLSEEDVTGLAEITHGYVGSDLSALVKEAGMIAMKDHLSNIRQQGDGGAVAMLDNFSLTLQMFRTAMCSIRVNAMKAVTVDVPKVYWSDIGGQHDVKQRMKEAIEWPLKSPHVFKRMGIKPPRGLLMYGPPGCSKTLTAKALATESGLNFISIKGPELFNKYLGESEKAIRDVFHKARISAPSIVFFDEIDAVGVQRSSKDAGGNNVADRVLAQLLTELDGVESLDGVIIIAATNRPDIIDPALLRPGRIDHLVYVPLPDDATRKEIFQIQFRAIPAAEDVDLDSLVALSAGYSGAEICSMCREAAMSSLRANFDATSVPMKQFEEVFRTIKPAVSQETINFYDNFKHKTTGSI